MWSKSDQSLESQRPRVQESTTWKESPQIEQIAHVAEAGLYYVKVRIHQIELIVHHEEARIYHKEVRLYHVKTRVYHVELRPPRGDDIIAREKSTLRK